MNASLDNGLGAIPATSFALPSLEREVTDVADLTALQPAKECLFQVGCPPHISDVDVSQTHEPQVPPDSKTTRMDILDWASESVHAFCEEYFSDTSSNEGEGSTSPPQATTSQRLTGEPVARTQCHDVGLQPI